MMTPKNVPVLVLASIIVSVRSSIDRPIESCPTNAIELMPNSSGWIENKGINFSEIITTGEGESFGCPCSFKICVSLCCPSGMIRLEGICVEDKNTSEILPRIINDDGVEMNVSNKSFHWFSDDPCTVGWMASSIIKKFDIFENGSVYTPEFNGGPVSNFDEYCLIRNSKSFEYLAKVCRPWIQKSNYEIVCCSISMLIMLVILIAYSIVPELKNFHGLVFRCYIATYIGAYACALGAIHTIEVRRYAYWFTFGEIIARYLCTCCTLWLNVMSFNIWRSFRGPLRPIYSIHKQQRKKFIWYAVYAWITPIVFIGIAAALKTYVPYFRDDAVGETLKQWGTAALFTYGLIFNSILHTSTALNIRQQKKETAILAEGVNKHYEEDKQWFNLYVKLFIIMGGHIVTWPIWVVWRSAAMLHFLTTLEVVEATLIMIIFVWKDSVKRSICKCFDKKLRSVVPAVTSFDMSHSVTPQTEVSDRKGGGSNNGIFYLKGQR